MMSDINIFTKPEFSNTYFDELEEAYSVIEDESNTIMLEAAITELGFLTESIVTGKLVISPVKEEVSLGAYAQAKVTKRNVEGVWEHIAYFFEKVMNFLSNSINNFIENAGTLFQDYEEWFRENSNKVDPDSMNPKILAELSFSVVPYFNGSDNTRLIKAENIKGITDIDKISEDLAAKDSAILKKADNDKNFLYQHYFDPLAKIDRENPKNASLIYWRGFDTNQAQFASVKVSNKNPQANLQATPALKAMLAFCANYRQAANAAKGMIDRSNKNMKTAKDKLKQLEAHWDKRDDIAEQRQDQFHNAKQEQKEANAAAAQQQQQQQAATQTQPSQPTTINANTQPNQPVNNSFYRFDENLDTILEGSLIGRDDLGFDIVLEEAAAATKPAPTEQQQQANANVEKTQKKYDQAVQAKKDTAHNIGIQKHIMSVCKIHQTIATSRMTATEEIFRHYVKVLQDIAAALSDLEGKRKEDQENRDYNQGKIDAKNAKRQEILDNDKFQRERAARNKGAFKRVKDSLSSNDLRK